MKNFDKAKLLIDVNRLVLKTKNSFMLDEDFNQDGIFNQFLNGFSNILNSYAPLGPQTKNEIANLVQRIKFFQQIITLNDKKPNGSENILIKFLKVTAECIIVDAVKIILVNKCIQKGIFPSKLKVANVTPVFKNDYTYKTTIIIERYPSFILSQKY